MSAEVLPVTVTITLPLALIMYVFSTVLEPKLTLPDKLEVPTVTVPVPKGPLNKRPKDELELLPAVKVPPLIKVPPRYRLLPDKVKVPSPILVSAPVVAVDAPEIVKLVPLVLMSIEEVVPVVRVKLRFVEAVAPVYCKVPPPSTKLAAALVAEPKLPPATPPLPIVPTLKMPSLIVVTPL